MEEDHPQELPESGIPSPLEVKGMLEKIARYEAYVRPSQGTKKKTKGKNKMCKTRRKKETETLHFHEPHHLPEESPQRAPNLSHSHPLGYDDAFLHGSLVKKTGMVFR